MNCTELHQDISKLKEQFNILQKQYNDFSNGANNDKTLSNNLQCAESLSDQILEKYLNEFAEHNSDILGYKYGEEIPGFNETVQTSLQLSDHEVLVTGNVGETRILSTNKNPDYLKQHLEDILLKGEKQ